MPGTAVELRGAALEIAGRSVWREVDLEIERGEFVAILGPNGAGKTTLLQVLLGMLALSGGTVTVFGSPPGARNDAIGYLPQRRTFDRTTRIRGIDVVRLGLDGRRLGLPLPPIGRLGASERRARARVAEVIELVGATDYANRAIGQLSGGEQQRLLIAQALARRPSMLILDEPLDSLDLANQSQVAALVARICKADDVAVLLVAHDVNPLLGYLDRVVYIAGGRALSGTPAEVITGPTLTALYGAPIEVLRCGDGRLVVVGQPEAPHHHGGRHDH